MNYGQLFNYTMGDLLLLDKSKLISPGFFSQYHCFTRGVGGKFFFFFLCCNLIYIFPHLLQDSDFFVHVQFVGW